MLVHIVSWRVVFWIHFIVLDQNDAHIMKLIDLDNFLYTLVEKWKLTSTFLKGKIGKFVPELLSKGRVRPCTFASASLVLNYPSLLQLSP
jgi:hypothetical protein